MSPIPAGSIVLVDFEAWTSDGELFDTTRPAVAEKAGRPTDELKGPIPVVLGGGRVVPGFEEAIQAADVGKAVKVKVPAVKAFGPRSDQLVRTFPLSEFKKQELEPTPGMRVEMQRRRGTVTQVTASRVKVDFNHPYAGEDFDYDFTVEKVLEDAEEKVRALIDLDFRLGTADDFSVHIKGETVTISVPEQFVMEPQWFLARHQFAHDVFDHTDVSDIVFDEKITKATMAKHHHGDGHGHHHGEEE